MLWYSFVECVCVFVFKTFVLLQGLFLVLSYFGRFLFVINLVEFKITTTTNNTEQNANAIMSNANPIGF